jgi:hypothetical protein
MTTPTLSHELLIPAGKVLLLGCSGVQLIAVTRGSATFSQVFERVCLGFMSITFFLSVARGLDHLAGELAETIRKISGSEDLQTLVLEVMSRASREVDANGNRPSFLNLPAMVSQAWRTGVWGVCTAIIEAVFLIASFLLEVARSVLWELLLTLFPIGAGLSPLAPKLLHNLFLYALELSLWSPILCLVEGVTAKVARQQMARSGALGLNIVGVELVAILLIFSIPMVTHKFLSGAFSGDLDAQARGFRLGKVLSAQLKAWRRI